MFSATGGGVLGQTVLENATIARMTTSSAKKKIAMSSLSKETLELIADWAEIMTVVLALASAFCGIVLVMSNKPLKRLAEQEAQEERRKTAEAQQKAAELQLALRNAAERAATPRRIIMGNRVTNNGSDQEVREAKFKELSKYSATRTVIVHVRDEEAEILAFDIQAALLKSGWKSVSVLNLSSTPIPLGFIHEGVQVRTMLPVNPSDVSIPPSSASPPPVVNALIALLNLDLGPPTGSPFGVRWEPDGFIHGKHPAGLIRYGFKIPENGVVITVGRKPAEQFFWSI